MRIEAKATRVQAFKSAMRTLKRTGRQAVQEEVARAALIIETNAKNLIRKKPKTGRIYKRGNIIHQASAPGEPPATDTGRLLSSIQHRIVKNGFEAYVGTNVEYGKFLEKGTKNMDPRPWLIVAVEMYRKKFLSRLKFIFQTKVKTK